MNGLIISFYFEVRWGILINKHNCCDNRHFSNFSSLVCSNVRLAGRCSSRDLERLTVAWSSLLTFYLTLNFTEGALNCVYGALYSSTECKRTGPSGCGAPAVPKLTLTTTPSSLLNARGNTSILIILYFNEKTLPPKFEHFGAWLCHILNLTIRRPLH